MKTKTVFIIVLVSIILGVFGTFATLKIHTWHWWYKQAIEYNKKVQAAQQQLPTQPTTK